MNDRIVYSKFFPYQEADRTGTTDLASGFEFQGGRNLFRCGVGREGWPVPQFG